VCARSEQRVDSHDYHGQRGGSGTPAARVSHGAKLPMGACSNTVIGVASRYSQLLGVLAPLQGQQG
jgi:hypothetical protein